MIKRYQKLETLFENLTIEIEKKFDNKLIVFRDSILEELRKEIGAVKSDSVFTGVNSIYESEPGDLKSRIKELEDQIKLRDNEIASLRANMNHLEEKIRDRVDTKAIN